jgi:hypothetical protein
VHVDGEPFTAGEVLEYTLLPRALDVIVPEKPPEPKQPPRARSQQRKTVTHGADSVVARMEELTELREKGLITEKEFNAKKKKLLNQL